MNKTKIQWTEMTWNPIKGCTKISDGCMNCYAVRMAKRLKAMGNPRYINEFDVTVHKDLLEVPLDIKQPRMIFVNSMSDLFHKDVPDDIIIKVFETMNKAHWHTFQVLKKRPERVLAMDQAGLLNGVLIYGWEQLLKMINTLIGLISYAKQKQILNFCHVNLCWEV